MVPIYWGIFIPNQGGTLDRPVIFQHVTYGFKTDFPEELKNRLALVKVVGYANDGNNEAYEVMLPTWTQQYYAGAKTKHITLSVSKTGKPVNSANLEFKPIENPFIIEGMFGYFDNSGVHF